MSQSANKDNVLITIQSATVVYIKYPVEQGKSVLIILVWMRLVRLIVVALIILVLGIGARMLVGVGAVEEKIVPNQPILLLDRPPLLYKHVNIVTILPSGV